MSLLKKIKLKTETILARSGIKLSLLLRWPTLTALVFAAITKQLNLSGEYTVLCMRRSIFMDDVRAMAKYSGRIHYLVVGRELVQQILEHFVGKKDTQILNRNYYELNVGAAGKEQCYEYLKKVWPIFQRMKKFDAVLYANFCYIEEQPLARACGDLGIPLIVLFKEGIVTPGTHLAWARKAHGGFQFRGQAKLLVYNEEIKKALAEINVPGLTADKMEVVGIPRMDRYFENKGDKIRQKQITFFSAYFQNILPLLEDDKSHHETLAARFDDFHRMVMEFAADHPEIKVIIKTKSAKFFLDYVLDILHKNFKKKISNLEIVNSGDPVQLIKNSAVVIGFGSTVLVEALVADKTIVCFDFAGLLSSRTFDYFRDYPTLVNYVKLKSDLEKVIINSEKYRGRNPQEREQFLRDILGVLDGRSSMRAEEATIGTIKEYKNLSLIS